MTKMIGAYEPLTPMLTAGSGSARWCIARRGGQRFFLKEFLTPVYPADTVRQPLKQKQLERCQLFEKRKRLLYTAMSCVIGDTLVPVLDFFCLNGRYYAVSEEVPEPHLTGESPLRLSQRERREILLGLALCLQRLHMQGIVHADLKPEHVLLNKGPLGYEVRLIDLDSGFLIDDPPQSEREIEGDPVYLAPEAFLCMIGQSASLTPALDTFAFGAVVHRLWTGDLPEIDHARYTYLYEAALDSGDIRLSRQLPLPYRAAVMKMLSADPAQRPSDGELVSLFSASPTFDADDKPATRPLNGLSRYMKNSRI